jgi:hypothetical protein
MAVAMELAPGGARKPSRQPQDHRAVLDVLVGDLEKTFAGRLAIQSAALPEGSSAAFTIRFDDTDFATFGVLDATYYWTFDGGESCHYAKDSAVMKRFLSFELTAAAAKKNS